MVTYVFDGWYTAREGGTKVEVLDDSLINGAILYAHWKTPEGTPVVIPEGEAKEKCDKMIADMTAYIENQPIFETAQPYLTFFDNMLYFHHNRIPR